MNIRSNLKLLATFKRIRANQWLDKQTLRELQTRKLRRIVTLAYEGVPYYRRVFDAAGLTPSRIRTLEDLALIPISTKSDLQTCSRKNLLHAEIDPALLSSEHSSGSTGQPFRVFYDRIYLQTRNMLFLRGLMAAGYRIGHKVLLITDAGKKSKPWRRWHYASILESPEQLLAKLNRIRPHILYGCKTPLVNVAEYACSKGIVVPRPGCVISTAEMLDTGSRTLLNQTFGCDVFDFYGSTEMGLVGWECRVHDGYHLSEDSVLVEYLPDAEGSGPARMVMTNLDLAAMPLLRYDTGDLGLAGTAERCSCGRDLAKLQRVEGRQNDCLILRDGRTISPYHLTCTLEKIPGILKYQVIQTTLDDFSIKVKTTGDHPMDNGARVREIMMSILGDKIRLRLDFVSSLDTNRGTKFRVVESWVARQNLAQAHRAGGRHNHESIMPELRVSAVGRGRQHRLPRTGKSTG